MTRAQPAEIEELSRRVLEIIGAYEMGATLEARDPDLKTAPAAPPQQPVVVPGENHVRDGVHRVVR